MTTLTRANLPAHALDEALAWAVRLRSGTADATARASCDAWRAANPAHEAAWQEMQTVEQAFEAVPPPQARLALTTLASAQRRRGFDKSRRKALKLLGLGATGGAALWLAAGHAPWRELAAGYSADYATGTGERRSVALADGSRLELNTATAVDVRFTAGSRLIVLRRGEIFIATGADEARPAGYRPLRVETPFGRLEAVGTRFHVRLEDHHTRLRVEEGAVRIEHGSAESPVVAKAGEEYEIGESTIAPLTGSRFDATAWTDGALVAKQMRLQDLLGELSRYRHGWLRCDPAIADLKVSGVFQLDDTDRALEALARSLPVRVERRTRYWVAILPR
jgi:ferric-dicitrate binding protein FerR (iron transport regulator)